MTYIETDCTIQRDGQSFEATGAVVTDNYAIAYIETGENFKDMRFAGIIIDLTDWHGNLIGHGTVRSHWRNQYGSYMYQVEGRINGVRYTGRTAGHGMIWRGKRCAKQS